MKKVIAVGVALIATVIIGTAPALAQQPAAKDKQKLVAEIVYAMLGKDSEANPAGFVAFCESYVASPKTVLQQFLAEPGMKSARASLKATAKDFRLGTIAAVAAACKGA